jgi:hypothetical protein
MARPGEVVSSLARLNETRKLRQETREENEMYGLAEYEFIRQRQAEFRHEAASNRLARELRANRGAIREGRARLVADARWELERYAGLLKKRLRGLA